MTDTDSLADPDGLDRPDLSQETRDRLTELQSESTGLPEPSPPPESDKVRYPTGMDAVDRVLHVLVSESHRELSVTWIAAAADVTDAVCKEVLGALVVNGVVTPPHEYGGDGYQLNQYYELYEEVQRDLDRVKSVDGISGPSSSQPPD